jgi:methanethiol S-methyltransferase
MGRVWSFTYGLVVYGFFLAVFCYAIGFVGNVAVPRSIDSGAAVPLPQALLVNLGLLSLFAVQHSGMARKGFKRWWTRIIPAPVERSTYVLLASLVLGLLFWQWRALPELVWSVEHPLGRLLLWGLFGSGWSLVLLSTFLINHFDLFGLRQVYRHLRDQPAEPVGFRMPWLYRFVRHPLYLGFIVAFWSTPQMSVGHLVFAAVTTAYILVAIQLEERDLLHDHGAAYAVYRRQVPMLMPRSTGGCPVLHGRVRPDVEMERGSS